MSLAVIIAGAVGCTVDRNGLGELFSINADTGGSPPISDDSGVDSSNPPPRDAAVADTAVVDAAAEMARDAGRDLVVADVAPDLIADRAPDRPADTPVDMRPTCSAGQHLCGNACADNSSVSSCGSSCTACPVPANGAATCNGATCGFACNTNFIPSESACIRSCTPTCEAGAVTVNSPGGRFTGTTAGASTSAGSCGGGAAPEKVFHIAVSGPSDLFVTTHGTGFDTVLYLRDACCGTELACNDNADGRHTSVLTRTGLAAGAYDLFVDGASADDAGDFTVDIFLSAASANPGESCGRPARLANLALSGTTCGFRDDYGPRPGCQASADSSFDTVYYFVLDQAATVTLSTCTSTCFDTVLYVRDVCTADTSQQVCNDDGLGCTGCASSNGSQSRASTSLAAGVHYVVVDTYPGTPCGAFTVTPQGVPP